MAVAFTQHDEEIVSLRPGTASSDSKSSTFLRGNSTSCINLLLLGKVGVGKARLLNEMFKTKVLPCGATTEVVKGVSQREASFQSEGVTYRAKVFDTVGIKKRGGHKIKISSTMSALRRFLWDIYPDGISVLLLVYRHGTRTSAERKRFLYILHRLNEERIPLITALVITGCAEKSEAARRRIVSEFDSNPQTQGIGRYVLQGMYAVGFTDLESIPEAMSEMYRVMNYRDALLLRGVVEGCGKRPQNADAFFYRGRYYKGFCVFPWHHCPCYDHIYTCLHWGYTWEECLRVEPRNTGL